MARKTSTQSAMESAFDPFLGRENNPFVHAARLQARALKAGLELQIEALDFVKQRYRRDMGFCDEMMDCREPAALASAVSRFYAQAIDDYSRETMRAVDLGTHFVKDAADDIRHEAQDMAEDAVAAAQQATDAA